ncbi:integral membrane protein [Intrasporangium chromatireducens Q5-1]|uniref:Integral membrane protein n=1 Tax=Intrasporangium chromatireducens Q5-1 TaxID=584657 RepID=W9GSA4_9MICO|nr:integral membrane protein [Intrasporangium chromatireducens]EWT07708.1 integral membrane protein [Intrasporangium chromatireducens Q5-1]
MTTRTTRSRLSFGVVVLALYAGCRAITTVVLLAVLPRQVPSSMTGGADVPVTYWRFTALWDGEWYQRIALHGYPDTLPLGADGHVQQNPWAFYPLFPFASRALMRITGLDFPTAGSTIALLCGFGAAVLMGLLLRERIGDRAALVVVVLWASFPASVTLQLAYTESLAMLLLVGYLYALDRRRWLVATGVALLVGLSRPIAVPLGLVTLVVVVVRWRGRDRRPIGAREYAAMAAALVGCAVAGFLWPAIAWWRTGSRSAYPDTMAAWRGPGELEPFTPWWGTATWWLGDGWGPVVLLAVPVVIIAMVAGPWAAALRADLRAWSLAYPLYLAAVLDPFTSIVRYLIPLFPLLVPLTGAGWSDRRGTTWRRLLVRAVPLLVLFVVGQYWWTDTLWRFVPPTDYPP